MPQSPRLTRAAHLCHLADYPPFENLVDGEYVGLDMDLGRAIAEELDLECVYTNIDFDGIVPAIVAGGQADAGLSGISITPEREEQVAFSDPYYVDNQAVCCYERQPPSSPRTTPPRPSTPKPSPSRCRAVLPARPTRASTSPTPRSSPSPTSPTASRQFRLERLTPSAATAPLLSRCFRAPMTTST